MAYTIGKKFEDKFQRDWVKSFPNSFCLRLPDQMTGYYNTSRNICDFICFTNSKLFLIECKTHKGASIPIDNITQYDRLIQYKKLKDVYPCVILWLYEKDVVYYIPIQTVEKIKKDGKKSIGLKAVEEGYDIITIPSVKLRTFMDSDYSILDFKENDNE